MGTEIRMRYKVLAPEHKTLKYVIEMDIDEVILPAVIWLNDQLGVMTLASCQGNDIQDAFVIFTHSEPSLLPYLLDFVQATNVDVSFSNGTISYRASWLPHAYRCFMSKIL